MSYLVIFISYQYGCGSRSRKITCKFTHLFRKNPVAEAQYLKNNILFLTFVITAVLCSTVLRFFCMNTIENYLSIKPIIADTAIAVIVGAFGYLLKPKNRFNYYFGMNISIALSNSVRKTKHRFLKLSVGRVQTPTLSILVDREKEASEKKVKQCREAGSKGGKSKRTLTDANETSEEQEKEQEQEKEKENEYENEKEKDQENAEEAAANGSVFQIPSVTDVLKYCFERDNDVDAEAFYDYYTSVGWMVGKNPMKDWRAVVRSWERKCDNNGTKAEDKKSSTEDDDYDDFFGAALENSYSGFPYYDDDEPLFPE